MAKVSSSSRSQVVVGTSGGGPLPGVGPVRRSKLQNGFVCVARAIAVAIVVLVLVGEERSRENILINIINQLQPMPVSGALEPAGRPM